MTLTELFFGIVWDSVSPLAFVYHTIYCIQYSLPSVNKNFKAVNHD